MLLGSSCDDRCLPLDLENIENEVAQNTQSR